MTIDIADLLVPRGVIAQLRVTNKKGALQEVARRAVTIVKERTATADGRDKFGTYMRHH